jgi:hypothetical protein
MSDDFSPEALARVRQKAAKRARDRWILTSRKGRLDRTLKRDCARPSCPCAGYWSEIDALTEHRRICRESNPSGERPSCCREGAQLLYIQAVHELIDSGVQHRLHSPGQWILTFEGREFWWWPKRNRWRAAGRGKVYSCRGLKHLLQVLSR